MYIILKDFVQNSGKCRDGLRDVLAKSTHKVPGADLEIMKEGSCASQFFAKPRPLPVKITPISHKQVSLYPTQENTDYRFVYNVMGVINFRVFHCYSRMSSSQFRAFRTARVAYIHADCHALHLICQLLFGRLMIRLHTKH